MLAKFTNKTRDEVLHDFTNMTGRTASRTNYGIYGKAIAAAFHIPFT